MINSNMYTAGLRKHPLVGFARSIYYTLTGQKIPVTLTHLDGNTDVRLKNTDIKSERPHIYPNPTDKQSFTVEIPDYDANKAHNCIVYDIYGKQICNYQVMQNSQIIDLPQVSSGMYIVQITSGTNIVHVEKVIVK